MTDDTPADEQASEIIREYRGGKRGLFNTVNRVGDGLEVVINVASSANPITSAGMTMNSAGKGDYTGVALSLLPGAGKMIGRGRGFRGLGGMGGGRGPNWLQGILASIGKFFSGKEKVWRLCSEDEAKLIHTANTIIQSRGRITGISRVFEPAHLDDMLKLPLFDTEIESYNHFAAFTVRRGWRKKFKYDGTGGARMQNDKYPWTFTVDVSAMRRYILEPPKITRVPGR